MNVGFKDDFTTKFFVRVSEMNLMDRSIFDRFTENFAGRL
jgi:hypothetical protein